MTDINIAKQKIESAGFLDIDIDANIDLFAEIERFFHLKILLKAH